MKLKESLLVGASLISLIVMGCGKKETEVPRENLPQLRNLTASVELYFTNYEKTYEKDSLGIFTLVDSRSNISFIKQSDFSEPAIYSLTDSTLPDVVNGEYDSFTVTSEDTITFSFSSIISGNLLQDQLPCNITFEEGSLNSVSANESAIALYTESGSEAFDALYSSQMVVDFKGTVEEMMWDAAKAQLETMIPLEDVQRRYALSVDDEILISAVPQGKVTFEGESATVSYDETLHFMVQYIGDFRVVE